MGEFINVDEIDQKSEGSKGGQGYSGQSEHREPRKKTPYEKQMELQGANLSAEAGFGPKIGALDVTPGAAEEAAGYRGEMRKGLAAEPRERGHSAEANGLISFVDPVTGNRYVIKSTPAARALLRDAGYTEGPGYVPNPVREPPTIA